MTRRFGKIWSHGAALAITCTVSALCEQYVANSGILVAALLGAYAHAHAQGWIYKKIGK